MTICLVGEPQSLYYYARPEPNRAHILATLDDGPIDSANYSFQPVLFDHLPSLANGEAVISTTAVLSGEMVVDALGRVQPLAPGLPVRLADGSVVTAAGAGSLSLPQMVVTFHLRPGLQWSDGAPLTAADSVFAFGIARSDDSFDPMRAAGDRTESYTAPDANTVVWTGLPGDLDPLYMTRFWPPLPRHQLGGLTAAQIAASDQAARTPLGWGPFAFQSWQPGQSLIVQRNPNYWRAAEGLPRLNQVTYRFLSTPDDLAIGLRDGSCDIVPSGQGLDQVADTLAIELNTDSQNGKLEGSSAPGTILEHLDFNMAPATGYTGTASSGLFQDARIRRGFAACLDRTEFRGWGAADAYVPLMGYPLAATDLPESAFNPQQGRALLAQAGWTDTNGDGLLDKNGTALTVRLAGDAAHQPLMQTIQAQLQRNCGVGVTLQTLTTAELQGDWPDGVVFGRRYDLAVFGWQVGALPPCDLFTTGEIASADNPGGANDTGYSNPAFDADCDGALFPLDRAADAQLEEQAQRIFAQDLPMLPLFFEGRVGFAQPGVRGYALDPTSPSELWNIENIQ